MSHNSTPHDIILDDDLYLYMFVLMETGTNAAVHGRRTTHNITLT